MDIFCFGDLREWDFIKNSPRLKNNIKIDDKSIDFNHVEWRSMAQIKGPLRTWYFLDYMSNQ